MREIAKILLKLKAVTLSPEDPYTWASGIKSPIYCDNRLTLSYPEDRKVVENGLVNLIKEKFSDAEYIMGTATAGIPHAAIIADKLNLPMGFVRSSNKDHGKQNKIEGAKIPGAKVVVIEDLFSTGGSSIEAAKALCDAGYEVLGIVSIFTYNMKSAEENFKASGFKHESLTNFDELIEVAHEMNYIKESEILKLQTFRDNPKDSSWMNVWSTFWVKKKWNSILGGKKLNYYKTLRKTLPYANQVFKNKDRLNKVIEESMSKTNRLELFKKISRELKLAFGLVIDYSKGNYRDVKKRDILLILAGFLYLLNPADIVPDFILFFGFFDDLSVLTYIIKKLDRELEKYDRWKNFRK